METDNEGGYVMISALLSIIQVFLACGLAGVLIIIGVVALLCFILKQVMVNIYYARHHKKNKGGDT